MKAIVCRKWGQPSELTYESINRPALRKGEVLVQVQACSVNYPDMLLVAGKYQAKPEFPFIPGSDVAGIVCKAADDDSMYSPGDRVMTSIPHGGFAEYVSCPENRLIPIPEGMSLKSAAASMMVHGTSYYALKQRAKLKRGETLLVLGAAGGCGMAAVMLGKAMGAKVIAAASTQEKMAAALKAGADEVVQYTKVDLKKTVKQLTKKKGVDVIFDPVGGDFAQKAVRCMAWGGRYLVIGFAAGSIPKIPANLLLLKSCALVGVFWGAWVKRNPMGALQNMGEIAQMMQEGKLTDMVSKIYSLKDTWQALDDLKIEG
eukprot:CAMPEP_0185254564 /NCGR_PEP_ID=MMETSP1359-20130426/3413_1 /TAXON_ID=552665 /ORGANISM="Bigelowiella longifila, Strain CCMP242" /LENGTH=315 /DNA_ID=CAMNT_0027837723 /DNA_START=3 /DNA_END=951 /DNA_ORIENTATION=+